MAGRYALSFGDAGAVLVAKEQAPYSARERFSQGFTRGEYVGITLDENRIRTVSLGRLCDYLIRDSVHDTIYFLDVGGVQLAAIKQLEETARDGMAVMRPDQCGEVRFSQFTPRLRRLGAIRFSARRATRSTISSSLAAAICMSRVRLTFVDDLSAATAVTSPVTPDDSGDQNGEHLVRSHSAGGSH